MKEARSEDVDPEVLERLLASPPDEFTSARDVLAAELKKKGRTAAAAALKGVRKPTLAVWAANALARSEPFVIRSYLGAVDRLRKVQLGALSKNRDPASVREAIEAERAALRNVAAALPRALGAAGLEAKPGIVSGALDLIRVAARQEEAARRLAEGRLIEPPATDSDDPLTALFGGAAPAPRAAPARATRADDAAAKAAEEAEKEAARKAAARKKEIEALRVEATQLERAAEAAADKAKKARDTADAAEAESRSARAAADDAASRLRKVQREE